MAAKDGRLGVVWLSDESNALVGDGGAWAVVFVDRGMWLTSDYEWFMANKGGKKKKKEKKTFASL